MRVQLVIGDGAVASTSPGESAAAASSRAVAPDEVSVVDTHAEDLAESTDVDDVAGIELLERELGGVKITGIRRELTAMFDGAIADLIAELGRLPGVGPKSASELRSTSFRPNPTMCAALRTQ